MMPGADVITVFQNDKIVVTTGQIGLYHVFIVGLKPKSFPTLGHVQQYIYQKTRQIIHFGEAYHGTEAETTGAGEQGGTEGA